MKDAVLDALRQHFRPEFLNRVDEIIVFHPLDRASTSSRSSRSSWSGLREAARGPAPRARAHGGGEDLLAQRGYDPVYGARPLKRVISNTVETSLAQKLISGEVRDGQRIVVDVGDGGLVFRSEGAAGAAGRAAPAAG